MRIYWVLILTIFQLQTFAQSGKITYRAFPITDYMQKLNDSTTVVQVQLPDGLAFAEKQVGILNGIFRNNSSDTVRKGMGRCQLIKGDYYYFAIHLYAGVPAPAAGDLIYTGTEGGTVYDGLIPKLAKHFIGLQDVYENNLYDRYTVFNNWTAQLEAAALDSMQADIRFTGKYFLENNPSGNMLITEGPFKGVKVFNQMISTTTEQISSFLEYVSVRPRLYAGKSWKISEIFATWLTAGAPMVIH